MAKELGADFQLHVKREDDAKQLAKSVGDKLGVQPHVAIECTGAESCAQTAIYVSVVLHTEGCLLAGDRVVFDTVVFFSSLPLPGNSSGRGGGGGGSQH